MSGISYDATIDWIFDWCVWFLIEVAPHLGLTYEEINIYMFIIIQPSLILLFMILWWKERFMRTKHERSLRQFNTAVENH